MKFTAPPRVTVPAFWTVFDRPNVTGAEIVWATVASLISPAFRVRTPGPDTVYAGAPARNTSWSRVVPPGTAVLTAVFDPPAGPSRTVPVVVGATPPA